jgi:hypothetical protein
MIFVGFSRDNSKITPKSFYIKLSIDGGILNVFLNVKVMVIGACKALKNNQCL